MLKYTNQNVTLFVTDKQFKTMEKDYTNVLGKIKTLTLNAVIDSLVIFVKTKQKKMRQGEYKVKIFSENSGYAKSCKWSRNSILCDFIVSFESASKFRIKEFTFKRTTLNGGEYCTNKIFTNDFNSRDYQIKLLTNSYNNCINLSNVQNLKIRLKNEQRIYNNFVSLMYNFEI